MGNRVQKLIKKLEAENANRCKEINNLDKYSNARRRKTHKYDYTCEIIQQLKNCLQQWLNAMTYIYRYTPQLLIST